MTLWDWPLWLEAIKKALIIVQLPRCASTS
jgi:hypothetical protein